MALSKRGKTVIFSLLAIVLLIVIVVGIFVYQTVKDLPDIGDVKSVVKSQTTYIYSADGTLLTRLFHENRTVVPLTQISKPMQQAVISVEDQRFYDHSGVDYIRIAGALVRDVRNPGSLQGASTITQQYVKNAYFSPEKTIQRKLREAFLASKLERNYTKQQILEKYLNSIYFGNGAYGVEAAAQSYFGVPASKLNVEQSALLAGIIKGPTLYNPYKNPRNSLERRNLVIGLMEQQGYVGASEARASRVVPLRIKPKDIGYIGSAPYYTEWIKSELEDINFDETAVYSQGLRIYTTLNMKLQDSAEAAWKKYLPNPKDPDVAIVSIDPKTGAVKAMVGGKDFNKQKMNLAAQGNGRQPGSSFKPFTLTAGLMNGVSPDDGFDASSPRTFKVPGTRSWTVNNYSGESSSGFTDLKRATAMSVNVVYADLITKVGADKVVDVAHKLGITGELNADPAIALGGLKYGVRPIDMAAAYATLANAGTYRKPFGVQRIAMSSGEIIYQHKDEPKQAIDQAVAYLVTDALKGVVSGGTGTRARIGRLAAGKTGTTQKYVDAWFCGYTPELSTAVWVGYKDENKPMTNVHGIRVAGGTFPAQIWASFMKKALKGIDEHTFAKAPKGSLSYITLCDETNLLPGEFCPKVSSHVFVKAYKPGKLKHCTIHKPITVPDLTGMSQEEAIKALTKLKLESSIVTQTSDQPIGIVLQQNPLAATEVKEGTSIQLAVSGTTNSGTVVPPQSTTNSVPNVLGMTADQATNTLESEGFVVGGEYRLSDMPADQVIGQRPPEGFIAQPGSTVTIVISGESGNVIIPNVRGKTEEQAKDILKTRGFEVLVEYDTDEQNIQKYGLGVVANQDPSPRSRTRQGARIVIYVTSR